MGIKLLNFFPFDKWSLAHLVRGFWLTVVYNALGINSAVALLIFVFLSSFIWELLDHFLGKRLRWELFGIDIFDYRGFDLRDVCMDIAGFFLYLISYGLLTLVL